MDDFDNPIGSIIIWTGGARPPKYYKLCCGSYFGGKILDIADYPDLYAAIGTKYGGDGVTTFALPLINHVDSQTCYIMRCLP